MGLPEFWFLIIAMLFVGYFVLEGFDYGVGMLMPFLGRSHTGGDARVAPDEPAADPDTRRRVLLNTIGPVWDGNEVWLITAGGALFAAFGGWYATMFSAFYFALFLILIGLITRVCAIEWRGKIDNPRWRMWCDVGIGLGSWIPAIVWGIAFANVVRGLPIDADAQYTGGFLDLFNPYALLGGLTTLLAFLTHGAVFLSLKTDGALREDSMRYASRLSIPTLVVAGAFLLWTQFAYGSAWTWIPVLIAAVAALVMVGATQVRKEGLAFAATSIAIVGTVAALFGSLYPEVLPSTLNPAYDLTIDNTSSSHYTLVVMTWAAALVTPVVIAYQAWTYWVFRKRLSVEIMPKPSGLRSLRAFGE
ncbi:cytochrome d ubiquinol oxidase subunit II [Gordonia amicalis]|uniref:Cytochrome d ubiquinol oxidase subunit II n=1 Tax=Gordonia amicalis TaxID=89053 RepID=A0AAE4R549_9ACTN|nr:MULTISPECIES: cytochrome d ubiquinol oxidase subunit II [Gordonia]MBA5848950.1 cytochrome d ubiquinol oxidase subunit II [Gordonia amicalis]MCZ4580036.1 cytochrome d ubiquinol oxidase subunit II [Gordonia amicalis]MDV6312172.1 cytochrome d ubiquinol oxidase subunit II [Gordonia amicalis]MDV7100466.1 cytochrome d ubiquinol oxidase subunit II [Gordonia amicalis]MDV7174202.1 cytochrome d ubiquinol oxidase subunit II [Gordonia amicalis]